MPEESGTTTGNETLNALKRFSTPESNPELHNLMEPNDNSKEKPGSNLAAANAAESDPVENLAEKSTSDDPPVVKSEKEEKEVVKENEVVKNAMFGDKDLSYKPEVIEAQAENTTSANSFAEFDKFLNESYGISNRDELQSRLDDLEVKSKSVEDLSSYKQRLDAGLDNLPISLHEAVTAAMNGEDWESKITGGLKIDIRKDVNEIADKDLLEAFAPGEFSSEDWDEFKDEDGDPSIKKAVNASLRYSKEKFQNLQNQKNEQFKSQRDSQAARDQKYLDSLSASTKNVSAAIEGIDEGYVKSIAAKVEKEGITSFFMNPDGTLKESALTAIVKSMPEYDDYAKIQTNNAVKEALNKERQEMLSRGSATAPARSGTSSGKEEIRPEVQKELDKIKNLAKKSRY